ncbi:MAG TPA: hypothetical protein PKU97_03395 [Kofleriaceae bacterium]|nr:hypothetical protein [Kofleriaceae bacterium]
MLKLSPVVEPPGTAARIGVLDRNRAVLARATRVVRAAAGLARIASDSDPAGLRAQLAPDTQLLVCDGADVELALDWAETRFPQARVITWSPGPMEPLVATAKSCPRLRSILGWPSFLSMPRPWELALAVRASLHINDAALRVSELFAGVPVATKYRPRTSAQRDAVTAEISSLAERAGATGRMIGRIGETCHELLMNAMYDAPVNHYGEPRYAHDRRATISLDEHELPTARLATDGTLLAIQVADPFGRLTRAHVLASICRGQAAAHSADADQIIDSSHGGAGLGLWKIHAAAASTIVDLVVGHSTTVTAVFDLDIGARESRTMPPSLHIFDHAELGP